MGWQDLDWNWNANVPQVSSSDLTNARVAKRAQIPESTLQGLVQSLHQESWTQSVFKQVLTGILYYSVRYTEM